MCDREHFNDLRHRVETLEKDSVKFDEQVKTQIGRASCRERV